MRPPRPGSSRRRLRWLPRRTPRRVGRPRVAGRPSVRDRKNLTHIIFAGAATAAMVRGRPAAGRPTRASWQEFDPRHVAGRRAAASSRSRRPRSASAPRRTTDVALQDAAGSRAAGRHVLRCWPSPGTAGEGASPVFSAHDFPALDLRHTTSRHSTAGARLRALDFRRTTSGTLCRLYEIASARWRGPRNDRLR